MLLNRLLIKKYSPFPSNYNLTEVMQYVDVAEKIWIVKTIGYQQYAELEEQVKNNNLTPVNATLLTEAIYPFLGFAIAYEALPMCWGKLTEVGVVKASSDNSESLSLKDMTYVQEHLRRQVEVRKDFAIEWINDHLEYYPLIAQCVGCDCSCCRNTKLNNPQKYQQLYGTNRRCIDLR